MNTQRTAPSISRRAFAAGLALSPFAVAAVHRDAAARQATPTADSDVFRYTFGDLRVCLFSTDHQVFGDATLQAANAPVEERRKVVKESGPFIMDNAVTLLETGDGLVLLDAGPWSTLPDRLEQEGYNPADVEVITFSNLHYDHTDGALPIGANDLPFPNARYILSRAEHDYWMSDDDQPLSEYVLPYISWMRNDARSFIDRASDQLELVEWEEEFLPGMRMIPAIGHTGGHAAVEIVSADETLLHVGDLIVDPILHLEHPDWYIAAAVWPDEDLASRRRLMDRAAEEHLLVQTVHFPFPGVGYVEKDGDAWHWVPLACGVGCDLQARDGA